MLTLDDSVALVVEGETLALCDTRSFHIVANDTSSLVSRVSAPGETPVYRHTLALMNANPPPAVVTLEGNNRQQQGRADGEMWTIRADADVQRIVWQRVSGAAHAPQSFRIRLPRQSGFLELWQTGSARQLVNEAVPGVSEDMGMMLTADDEDEVLFYSVNPRNILLLRWSRRGKLTIARTDEIVEPIPGTPYWELNADGMVKRLVWELTWTAADAGDTTLTLTQGAAACAQQFNGRYALALPDAAADFGAFFYQAALGTLPLNLRVFDEGLLAPRCNVLMANVEAYKDAWTRDVAFGYLCMAEVDPPAIARLSADYIRLMEKYRQSGDPQRSPVLGYVHRDSLHYTPTPDDYWDDAAAETLMLGGLHYRLTGDVGFVRAHLDLYGRCGAFLRSRIREGDAIPITTGTWDAQGVLIGKEPYFTAECYSAFNLLAELLEAVGDAEAERYRADARLMKAAANRDYRDGGLWQTERGTFINHIDHKAPHLRSPRTESWNRSAPEAVGHPRTEYAHYETIVPIWLGLLDDADRVRGAFAWIDAHYTYASGRGGVSFPPFFQQTFIGLVDVCVRQQYGIEHADRLLQLIVDRAFDGGIPFPEWQFGAYRMSGSLNPDFVYSLYAHTHSGRVWDNAPYFALVMQQHYGLRFTHRGWEVRAPRPLRNYPLTRLGGLRYHDATYTITWQGTGALRRVLVDGRDWAMPQIDLRDGAHEVIIALGG